MLDLAFRRRLLEVTLDFFLIGVSYYLAFLVRFSLAMDSAQLEVYLQSLPIALAAAYLSFYALGVYRGVWRYVDVNDLLHYFQAAVGSVVLLSAALFILGLADMLPWAEQFAPAILLLFGVFLFLGLIATRASFRVIELFSPRQKQVEGERVLIYGAGDSGEMALRWILMNPQLDFRPIGLLNDSPYMAGRQIHRVEVLGGLDQLEEILDQYQVRGVVYAGGEADQDPGLSRLFDTCQRYGCWVRKMRVEFENVV
jgi:UDP-GlcNAc:undecaprenyl-phosphate GlcNAc-1-phosphate transferase